MSQKVVKNTAHSVRQRLMNRAKSEKRPFSELLQYFTMERFLYRLSESPHADRFILKGAMMLKTWGSPEIRPTMDIDMLGRTSNEEAALAEQIRDILSVEVEPDGLIFDPTSIQTERITEDTDYKGIRIQFLGKLDPAKIRIQIDIGFGDIVYPKPERSELPVMLDFPTPRLLCYSRESAIAEKFETMLKLRELNSRMKDFYDIWLLSRQFSFEGKVLAEAIRLTLEKRGTGIPDTIPSFSEEFAQIKQVQWEAFLKKVKQDNVPENFSEVATQVKNFLFPISFALTSNSIAPVEWAPPGPWK